MVVITTDGYLDVGSHDDHTFRARQGLVYSVEEVPGDGLERTDLAIEAPHSHHVLADRIDVTKEGAGVHRIVRSLYSFATVSPIDFAVQLICFEHAGMGRSGNKVRYGYCGDCTGGQWQLPRAS